MSVQAVQSKFLLLAAIVSTGCAEVRTPGHGGGGSGGQPGPSTGSGGTNTSGIGGNGGTGGQPEGGSAGTGGAPPPPLPPLPPCFPDATDDFTEPTISESTWFATNVEFQDGTALLGAGTQELALLHAQASLPQTCFLSFRIGTASSAPDLDAYVLLRPEFNDLEEFIDLDISVTDSHVMLYVRPEPYTEPQPRTGDQFLLLLSGVEATLYQSDAANTSWQYVNTLEMPHALTEAELLFVRYDTLPPFWVDDVTRLPDALIAGFPPL